MNSFKAIEINIGHHNNGYRIDKTASAMNRYTQWKISTNGEWTDSKPVCFHSLPIDGWLKDEKN